MTRALFVDWTAWIREEGGLNRLLGMMHPELHGQQPPVQDDDTDHMSNWMNPIVPIKPTSSAVFNEEHLHIVAVHKGSLIKTKKALILAIGVWQLESQTQYRVGKSDRTILVLKCKVDTDCNFNIRAITNGEYWVVSVFDGEHDCHESGITSIDVECTF